jgi:hypothetical protein
MNGQWRVIPYKACAQDNAGIMYTTPGLALQNVLQTWHIKLDKTIFSTMYSTRNTHIVHRDESVSVACVLVTVC